jgi:hypothetical protein
MVLRCECARVHCALFIARVKVVRHMERTLSCGKSENELNMHEVQCSSTSCVLQDPSLPTSLTSNNRGSVACSIADLRRPEFKWRNSEARHDRLQWRQQHQRQRKISRQPGQRSTWPCEQVAHWNSPLSWSSDAHLHPLHALVWRPTSSRRRLSLRRCTADCAASRRHEESRHSGRHCGLVWTAFRSQE